MNEATDDDLWWQALVQAIRQGLDAEFARLLARAGNLDSVRPPYISTPLCEAARVGNAVFVEALCAAGADVNRLDERGMTPLLHAVKMEHLDAAWALLRRGASLNLASPDGAMPLHWVALYCQRPKDQRQRPPDLAWLDLGIAMLEAGADGQHPVGGESALDDCPALRAEWERRLLQRATTIV